MFKNILTMLLLVASLFAVDAQALLLKAGSAGSTASSNGSFVVREQVYIRGYNKSGGTVSQYALVVADTTEDDGYSFNTTTTSGAPALGVVQASCSNNSDCLLQVYGYGKAFLVTGTSNQASAGECVFAGSTAGSVHGIRDDRTLTSASVPPACLGVFLDASGDDDSDIEVLLQML